MNHKPLCECGGELYWQVDKVIPFVEFDIKKDGRLKKYSSSHKKISADCGENYGFGKLNCRNCNNEYNFDMDVKTERILRGDRIR